MKLYDILKTILLILIFIALWPSLWNKIKTEFFESVQPKNKVGIVLIDGNIENSEDCINQLHDFFQSSDIKAIMLDIDCSGGNAGASQAIACEILQLKKKHPKPIISYTENCCTSGAYLIACSTDYIISTGSCIIGSIGSILSQQFYIKDFLHEHNIQTLAVQSGDYKNSMNFIEKPTEENIAMLQSLCDDTYKQFYTFVATRRNLPLDNLETWANGKLFTGMQAQENGLIDATGSRDTVKEYIKKHIVPSNRPIEWIKTPKNKSWEKYLDWNFDFIQQKEMGTYAQHINTLLKRLPAPIAVR